MALAVVLSFILTLVLGFEDIPVETPEPARDHPQPAAFTAQAPAVKPN